MSNLSIGIPALESFGDLSRQSIAFVGPRGSGKTASLLCASLILCIKGENVGFVTKYNRNSQHIMMMMKMMMSSLPTACVKDIESRFHLLTPPNVQSAIRATSWGAIIIDDLDLDTQDGWILYDQLYSRIRQNCGNCTLFVSGSLSELMVYKGLHDVVVDVRTQYLPLDNTWSWTFKIVKRRSGIPDNVTRELWLSTLFFIALTVIPKPRNVRLTDKIISDAAEVVLNGMLSHPLVDSGMQMFQTEYLMEPFEPVA